MARTNVFIEDNGKVRLWRTDLHGHGDVTEGEKFVIRELEQYGSGGLVKDGIKRRVRVHTVRRESSNFHVLSVDVLDDMTPETPRKLFD